jgi:hypothetical protein
LYWLTNTATSAVRLYWKNARSIVAVLASGHLAPELFLAVAFTVSPQEIFQAPRGWAEKVYPKLELATYIVEKGNPLINLAE